MIKDIKISRFAIVRIAFDKRQELQMNFDAFVDAVIDSSPNIGRVPLSFISLEALVNRGPRSEYGMIGFEFIQGSIAKLEIKIGNTPDPYFQWKESLLLNGDVIMGMPTEFALPTLNGLIEGIEDPFPGNLVLVEAAYSSVESSPIFFKHLASALGEIMFMKERERTDDVLSTILRSRLIGV